MSEVVGGLTDDMGDPSSQSSQDAGFARGFDSYMILSLTITCYLTPGNNVVKVNSLKSRRSRISSNFYAHKCLHMILYLLCRKNSIIQNPQESIQIIEICIVTYHLYSGLVLSILCTVTCKIPRVANNEDARRASKDFIHHQLFKTYPT